MSIGSSAVAASLRAVIHKERVENYNKKVAELLKDDLIQENMNEILDHSHLLELNNLKSLWGKIDNEVKINIIMKNFESEEWLIALVNEKMMTDEQYQSIKCSFLKKEDELFLIIVALMVIPTILLLFYTGIKEFITQDSFILNCICVIFSVPSILIPIIFVKKHRAKNEIKVQTAINNIKKLRF